MSNRAGLQSLVATILSATLIVASAALAEEAIGPADPTFSYQHDPIYNPRAMVDVVVDPDAVYGFSPNPDAGSISGYAVYDWMDPEFVAQTPTSMATRLLILPESPGGSNPRSRQSRRPRGEARFFRRRETRLPSCLWPCASRVVSPLLPSASPARCGKHEWTRGFGAPRPFATTL